MHICEEKNIPSTRHKATKRVKSQVMVGFGATNVAAIASELHHEWARRTEFASIPIMVKTPAHSINMKTIA
jgi:hypothetical protein